MFIKGKVFYYCLALLIGVLGRMLHPVFYLFLIIYLFFLLLNDVYLMIRVVCILGLLLLLRIPESLNKTEISGKIISVDDNSIVVRNGYYKFKVYGDFVDCRLYDEISLVGSKYEINKVKNDYAFDYQKYLYSINIFDVLKLEKIISYKERDHLYHILENRINTKEEVNGLLSLFLLGIKDEQMQEYYQKLTDLSIVHLFALSGMHLTVLQKWLKQFLKFIFSNTGQQFVSLIIIGIYLTLIPYNISYLRAYLMMVLSFLFGKWLNKLDIFSLLTIGMLFYNPYLIYNLSFVFSYTIYFFIILLQNNKAIKYYLFLGSIPIIISIQHVIPVFSFIIGILLTPLIELLYKGMLYYVLFGKIVLPVLVLAYDMLKVMIDFLYDVSFELTFSQPTLFFIGVYYYWYLKGIYKINIKRRYNKELIGMLAILIAFYFYPYYSMKGQVVMLDVGQGDCFFIQQPFNAGNVLIDTGGLKNTDIAINRIIPFLQSQGVHALDAIFISHEDYDHCGALDSLKSNFKIKEVVYDFKRKQVGNLEFINIALDRSYTSTNDRSSVIYVTINNLNYLFTGDISMEVEKQLYQEYNYLDVDILKVAHHGSGYSTSDEMLKLIDPKVALISVGKNNVYKHPSGNVVKKLRNNGTLVYRSDVDGMVKIVYYGGKNYLFTNE